MPPRDFAFWAGRNPQNTVILVLLTLCWRERDLPNIIKAKEGRIPGRRIHQNIVNVFHWYNMSQGVQNSISVPLDRCGYNADPLGNLRFPNSFPFGQRSLLPSARKYFTRFLTLVDPTVKRGVRSAVKFSLRLPSQITLLLPADQPHTSPLSPEKLIFYRKTNSTVNVACSAGVFFERAICSRKRHVETSRREERFPLSSIFHCHKIKDGGYYNITNCNGNKVSPTQNTPELQATVNVTVRIILMEGEIKDAKMSSFSSDFQTLIKH